MKDTVAWLFAIAFASLVAPTVAEKVPQERYTVCVVTVDDSTPRFAAFADDLVGARNRRNDFLTNGWELQGSDVDILDFYPPHSIVKVIIDDTFYGKVSCIPIN